MFTPIPFFNFYYKYIGIIISITGILLSIFPMEYSHFGAWVILFGLFTIAYSKDRSKNQQLRRDYRYNAFRISFALIFLIIIITTFRNIIAGYTNEMNILHFGIGYLLLYLIVYYIHIVFDIRKLQTDQDLSENYKNNKSIYLIIYLIAILLVVMTFVFSLN